jgi:hypothetical protein
MKRVGIISAAVLFVFLGITAPVYARPFRREAPSRPLTEYGVPVVDACPGCDCCVRLTSLFALSCRFCGGAFPFRIMT